MDFGFQPDSQPLQCSFCAALTFRLGALGRYFGLLMARILARTYALFYIRRTCCWKWSEFLPGPFVLKLTLLCGLLSLGCWRSRSLISDPFRWFISSGSFFTIAYFAVALSWWKKEALYTAWR